MSIDHAFLHANGLRLHCAVAGEGPLMLFLHGFPEFWRCWRAQLEHFGARGRMAVAPDLRGYNRSDKPAGVESYRAKHVIEDVRQLAAGLMPGKFVLVGHDWGGAAAWGLAAASPELLSHLVIVNSPHPYTFWRELTQNPAQQRASEYMLRLREPGVEERLAAGGYEKLWRMITGDWGGGAFAEADRRLYEEAWSQPGALAASLNYYRATPLVPPTPQDPGARRLTPRPEDFTVRVPTLVIWGERDRALLPGCLDGLEACVPDLTLVRVPEASHWIVHEQPALVNREIERFLAR